MCRVFVTVLIQCYHRSLYREKRMLTGCDCVADRSEVHQQVHRHLASGNLVHEWWYHRLEKASHSCLPS